jgi:hypothetical protein
MERKVLNKIIEKIETIRNESIKRFTDECGFPGFFESTSKFKSCIDELNSMQDWELEDPRNVGDLIMIELYTEDLEHVDEFREECEFINNRIQKLMTKFQLCRNIDKKRWDLNKEGK